MSYIQGIDVSDYNPRVDWHKLRNQDIRFALIKSTEGTGHFNEYFNEQWAGAKSAGILRGSYHYLRAAMDGIEQADFFLSKVDVQDGDLPPILDVEAKYNEGASNFQFIDSTQKWLEHVESKTGRTPIVYAQTLFLQQWGPLPWAKNHQTWIAEWYDDADNGEPSQPAGWGGWIFWQYSGDRVTLDGVYDDSAGTKLRIVDRNAYRYSLEELYKLAKASLPADGMVASHQSVQANSSAPQKTYVVQPGDTLNSIALRNGTTAQELASLNNVNKKDIVAGKVLKLP
jgi:GH25 family lysozyme M1 (1,4-beta-N-acetylmuramidase)